MSDRAAGWKVYINNIWPSKLFHQIKYFTLQEPSFFKQSYQNTETQTKTQASRPDHPINTFPDRLSIQEHIHILRHHRRIPVEDVHMGTQ